MILKGKAKECEIVGLKDEESGMPAHVIVVGLGIAGSGIAATLARRGFQVTGVEQFAPLHERGSSHGDTRIYRRVPHEGDVYVGMASESLAGWRAWNELAGEKLLVECGGIDAGPAHSPMVAAAEELCLRYGQAFELMSGETFNRRHGHFNLPGDWRVVFQPESGVVRPDATRSFLHRLAREAGARLMHGTPVLGIESSAAGVGVEMAGETLIGDAVVVSAGSWLSRMFPELDLPLRAERRVLAWHRPDAAENLMDGRLPIFCFDADGGWYGMPTPDGRIKIGHDKHLRQRVDPENQPIAPGDEDAAFLEACVGRYFRGFEARVDAMKPCIYTIAEDHHFLVDWHPAHANVLLFSCCSGHGFKYAPVYGEIAADLIAGRERPELGLFGLARGGVGVTRFGPGNPVAG
jgi:sarcosine oxidase